MLWQYFMVLLGSFVFDVVPIPFPPAFTIMLFLQIKYDLNIWFVISLGVMGSILGRYVLTLYIPRIANSLFKASKNEDVQFLGEKMKEKGWKSQVAILLYSLLPLPTTPLFLAGGMARIKPLYIIPAFFVGKFTSDAIVVHLGKYTSENIQNITKDMFSWETITSFLLGLIFIFLILFVNWRSLIQKNKLQFNFRIWK
jgi:membrane protein YqaA with SNARE-associated domain